MADDDTAQYVGVDLDTDLADKWLDAKQAYDEVKAYFDEIDQQVRDHVTATSDKCDAAIQVNGRRVATYARYKTSRLNTTRLKREFPDIAAQYTESKMHWRLTWATEQAWKRDRS